MINLDRLKVIMMKSLIDSLRKVLKEDIKSLGYTYIFEQVANYLKKNNLTDKKVKIEDLDEQSRKIMEVHRARWIYYDDLSMTLIYENTDNVLVLVFIGIGESFSIDGRTRDILRKLL